MSRPTTEREALAEDLGRLRCVYSRMFGVCVACPQGSHLPDCGTPAVAFYAVPEFGEYGLCAVHDDDWGLKA